ncbi:hypothetical protein RSOCI_04705 [Rhabdochlamydiaceae symbiont of Dictyostelium giganteum]
MGKKNLKILKIKKKLTKTKKRPNTNNLALISLPDCFPMENTLCLKKSRKLFESIWNAN